MSDRDEAADDEGSGEFWSLRLYVAGHSPKSLRAYANLKAMCDDHLSGRYEIEVIDLVEYPDMARSDDVLATPTLVRRLPPPVRTIVGDLSNTESLLIGLQLHPQCHSMTSAHDSTRRRFEAELAAQRDVRYDLTLFVSGASGLAARAIANARHLCDVHLAGRADLSVVDVHADIEALSTSGVVATPTLVKNFPLPVRRIVGDLLHIERVLLALDLPPAQEADVATPTLVSDVPALRLA